MIFAHDERSRRQIEEIQARLGGKPMKKIDARSSGDIEQLEQVGFDVRGFESGQS